MNETVERHGSGKSDFLQMRKVGVGDCWVKEKVRIKMYLWGRQCWTQWVKE